MRAAALLLCAALTGCATTQDARHAQMASLADAGTTAGAIAYGATEANPLLSGSPAGIAGTLAVKLGMVAVADRLEPETRAAVLRGNTALWGGASINNLALILGASGPQAVIFGLGAGVAIWAGSAK